MKSLFTIALLTAGLQALHLNTDSSIDTRAFEETTDIVAAPTDTPTDTSTDPVKPASDDSALAAIENSGSNSA